MFILDRQLAGPVYLRDLRQPEAVKSAAVALEINVLYSDFTKIISSNTLNCSERESTAADTLPGCKFETPIQLVCSSNYTVS